MSAQKNTIKRLFTLGFLSVFLISCRKEITAPSNDSLQVFGNWEWVSSKTNGYVVQTPTSEGYTLEYEFASNGVFKELTDGKKTEKLTFEFIEGTSVNGELSGYKIKYRNAGLNKKEKYRDEFSIHHEDTLFLKRECAGCYTRMFVRK